MKLSMKRFFAFTSVALALCLPVQYAQGVVINFDAFDTSGGNIGGAPVVAYLAGFGITFSGAAGVAPIIVGANSNGNSSASPPNAFEAGAPGGASAAYTFDFGGLVDFVSFVTMGTGPSSTMASWIATAYSATNSILAQVSNGFTGTNTPGATWLLNAQGIDRVDFVSNPQGAGHNLTFDNLTFAANVEEPAMAWLLALGIFALAAGRRRTRANTYAWPAYR